jgi:hypothetical protein
MTLFLYKKKKKQKLTGCNRVFDRILSDQLGRQVSRVTPVFYFPVFSSTRPGSSPGSTCRAGPGFKTMVLGFSSNITYSYYLFEMSSFM